MSSFKAHNQVKTVYRGLKQTILSLSEGQLAHIPDESFRLILWRSQNFHRYKKEVGNSVLRNRSVSDFLSL